MSSGTLSIGHIFARQVTLRALRPFTNKNDYTSLSTRTALQMNPLTTVTARCKWHLFHVIRDMFKTGERHFFDFFSDVFLNIGSIYQPKQQAFSIYWIMSYTRYRNTKPHHGLVPEYSSYLLPVPISLVRFFVNQLLGHLSDKPLQNRTIRLPAIGYTDRNTQHTQLRICSPE